MPPQKTERQLTFHPETGLCVPAAVIWVIFIMVFIDTISVSISNPVMPFYASSFHVDSRAIGNMYAATSLASFFGIPFLTKLNDRYGRRPVMLWTCIGSGIAGLGQAFSPTFLSLFIFRTFSGIFGAVTGVAQVYVADVCSPEALPEYVAKLAAVPNLSQTLGPGLGGGLSKFGMWVPIFVDGVLSLLLGALVYVYVPESPAFLARQAEKTQTKDSEKSEAEAQGIQDITVPRSAYIFYPVAFFNGIQIGICMSMLAISMKAKFKWDALHVGYLGVVTSIVVLATTIWITPRVVQRIGAKFTVMFGGCMIACGFILMGSFADPVLFLAGNGVRSFGMGLRQGSMAILQAQATNPLNRAVFFGRIAMSMMAGTFIGPIVGGHIARIDPKSLLWWFPAGTTLISSLFVLLLKVGAPKKTVEPLLEDMAAVSEQGTLVDELGSDADYADLAQHVGGLLTRRHYRWVSHKEQVYAMLDRLLPELSSEGPKHMEDMRRVLKNADAINAVLA